MWPGVAKMGWGCRWDGDREGTGGEDGEQGQGQEWGQRQAVMGRSWVQGAAGTTRPPIGAAGIGPGVKAPRAPPPPTHLHSSLL